MNSLNQVRELLDEWYNDTKFHSNLNKINNHPSAHKLKEYGFDVVPILLKELQGENAHWGLFSLLRKITELNPTNKNHIGNFKELSKDWVCWGKKQGLI